MKQPTTKKHVLTPEERRRRNRRISLVEMVMAVGWCVIMINMDEHIFVRWFAAIVLFAAGLTGYFGIGTERTRKTQK